MMFKIDSKKKLRSGVIGTAHGKLSTPFFMPDATRGFVKLLTEKEVKSKKGPERNADKRPRAQFFRGRAPSASSADNGRSQAPGPGAR